MTKLTVDNNILKWTCPILPWNFPVNDNLIIPANIVNLYFATYTTPCRSLADFCCFYSISSWNLPDGVCLIQRYVHFTLLHWCNQPTNQPIAEIHSKTGFFSSRIADASVCVLMQSQSRIFSTIPMIYFHNWLDSEALSLKGPFHVPQFSSNANETTRIVLNYSHTYAHSASKYSYKMHIHWDAFIPTKVWWSSTTPPSSSNQQCPSSHP